MRFNNGFAQFIFVAYLFGNGSIPCGCLSKESMVAILGCLPESGSVFLIGNFVFTLLHIEEYLPSIPLFYKELRLF